MFKYEYEAWNHLAKSWRDIAFTLEDDGIITVTNRKYDSYGLCLCIFLLHRDGLITYGIHDSMQSKIKKLCGKPGIFLFPCDQQGAESRRKLCLELAFQNILEEHNGKLPTIN